MATYFLRVAKIQPSQGEMQAAIPTPSSHATSPPHSHRNDLTGGVREESRVPCLADWPSCRRTCLTTLFRLSFLTSVRHLHALAPHLQPPPTSRRRQLPPTQGKPCGTEDMPTGPPDPVSPQPPPAAGWPHAAPTAPPKAGSEWLFLWFFLGEEGIKGTDVSQRLSAARLPAKHPVCPHRGA